MSPALQGHGTLHFSLKGQSKIQDLYVVNIHDTIHGAIQTYWLALLSILVTASIIVSRVEKYILPKAGIEPPTPANWAVTRTNWAMRDLFHLGAGHYTYTILSNTGQSRFTRSPCFLEFA